MKHPKSYDSTPETRKRMAGVRLKGGRAETALAKALWRRGYRYRKNDKRLPGSPDIAILKHRIAVFVDGEFWHGKDWVRRKDRLRRNRTYWIEKIEENIARDQRNDQLLAQLGWTPVHFWEKDVLKSLPDCVEQIDDLALALLIAQTDRPDPPAWEEAEEE
jgi:DNA mismatch endonuclease (patch repair protein)